MLKFKISGINNNKIINRKINRYMHNLEICTVNFVLTAVLGFQKEK